MVKKIKRGIFVEEMVIFQVMSVVFLLNPVSSYFFRNMPDCCVIGCNFRKSAKGTFQSFKFPKDPVQRGIWVDAVKRGRKYFILKNETVICKRHFTPDDLLPVFDSRKRQGPL